MLTPVVTRHRENQVLITYERVLLSQYQGHVGPVSQVRVPLLQYQGHMS